MAIIAEETIKAVLDATDIVDVISRYFPLKKSGTGFVCNCPFHNEKTPSFNINPVRQFYHCFGCGESGDAITFVKKYENLPFVEAVTKLADNAGIPIMETAYDPKAEKKQRQRSRLITLHNEAAEFMHQLIRKSPQAAHAREYLKNRAFDATLAKEWKVGWMPEDPQQFLTWAKEKGYRGKELCDSGLAALKQPNNPKAGLYVRFLNRLMFPIHNDYGDIIAFSGRQLVHNPNTGKYINSPQTSIFDKSRTFFGLDKSRKHMTSSGYALICEGQIDAIVCHQHGIKVAIAPLGTACTEHHARILKRYTSQAILCYDADSAGYKAVEKAFRMLAPAGIHVRCIDLPEGEDPDTYIKKYGIEAFETLLKEAKEFFEYKLHKEASLSDLNNIQIKMKLVQDLTELLTYIESKIAQDTLIQRIAAQLGIPATELRKNAIKEKKKKTYLLKQQQSREQRFNNQQTPTEQQEAPIEATPMDSAIATLCSLAMGSTEVQDYLSEQMEALHEPLQKTTGGNLLLNLLARRPDASSAAAIMAYLTTLNPNDALALQNILAYKIPSNPVQAATEASNMLINKYYQREEASIRAALTQPNLSDEETIKYMERAKELQAILKNLKERFIR